jgi:DNA modification methylase
LQQLDFDMDLTGFSSEELMGLLSDGTPGLTDPDDIPEPPDKATTQPGDLWILGNHRLLCADSSKAQDVDRLLDGAAIHLINTDPPYNVKVEPRSNNAIAAGLSSFEGTKHHQKLDVVRHPAKAKPTGKKLRAKDRPLANDFVTEQEFDQLLNAWFGNMARVLLPGRSFYIWGGYANCGNYPPVLKASGLYFSQAIIWVKEHPVLTRKDFMGNHEWCFYGWREGAGHKFLVQQRRGCVAHQEDQPSKHGPFNRETRRVGHAGNGILVPAGGECPRFIWGKWFHSDRRGEDGASGVPYGTRCPLL